MVHCIGSAYSADEESAKTAAIKAILMFLLQRCSDLRLRSSDMAHRPAAVPVEPDSFRGCYMTPLPAESHAAKRTHFLPAALNGIWKRWRPIGGRSLAGMIWRSVFCPSPHTTSTISRGNVHSTSAVIVRALPVPSMEYALRRTSPEVTK